MKKVLITGGCGFAGHHLVEHLLLTTDWDLVVLDSLTYAGRPDRLTDCEGYDVDRVRLLWHDLRAPIHRWLDRQIGDVNTVLHLAANSHVDRSILDPGPFARSNFDITLNLLEWAKVRMARNDALTHFVQISTDEVYGPAAEEVRHREWDPHIPSNPYAASKSAQEALAIAWWRTYGVPVVVTNTMNMFGERQDPEKFVPMAIKAILSDRPVTIHARKIDDGWEPSSRHWLHARNHADALRWIVENTTPIAYPNGDRPDRWHIAGEEADVLDMAHHLALALNEPLRYQYVDYHASRPGHDHRYALDASKIAKAGWTPPINLSTSLAKTATWFQRRFEWLA